MSTYIEKSRKTIPPLLSTTWGIHAPYNLMMPTRPKKTVHYPPGCNAVAMAQIVFYYAKKYYKNDTVFTVGNCGSHFEDSNQNPTEGESTSITRTYNWNSIKNSNNYHEYGTVPTSTWSTNKFVVNNNTSAAEVAKLMYDCMRSTNSYSSDNVAVYAWGYNTANTNSHKTNIGVAKFYINNKTRIEKTTVVSKSNNNSLGKVNISFAQLEEYIYNELSQGRPVFCEGHGDGGGYYGGTDGAHIYIIDGYNNGLFHIIFGWGGKSDGYHRLNVQNTALPGNNNFLETLTEVSYNQYLTIYGTYPYKDFTNNASGEIITPNILPEVIPNTRKTNDSKDVNNSHAEILSNLIVTNINTSLCDGVFNIKDKDGNVIQDTQTGSHKQILRITIKNTSTKEYYISDLGLCSDSGYKTIKKGLTIYPKQEITVGYAHRFTAAEHNKEGATISIGLGNVNSKLKDITGKTFSKKVVLKKTDVVASYPTLNNLNLLFEKYGERLQDNIYHMGDDDVYLILQKPTDKEVNPNDYDIVVPVVYWLRYITEPPTANNPGVNFTRYNNYGDNCFPRTVVVKFPAKGHSFELLNVIKGIPKNVKVDIRLEGNSAYYSGIGKNSKTFKSDNVAIWYNSQGYKTVIVPNNNKNYQDVTITVDEKAVAVDFTDIGTIKNIIPNSNPNTLYYFGSNQTVPSNLNGKNVIKGNKAAVININMDYDFMVPITFESTTVRTKVNYSEGYSKGSNKLNWKTIAFPFNVSSVTCEDKELKWFKKGESEGDFWLQKFGGINVSDTNATPVFEDVDSITAYTSYIINIPGSSYNSYSLEGKDIYFIGENFKFNRNSNLGVYSLTDQVVTLDDHKPMQLSKEHVIAFEPYFKNDECYDVTNFEETTSVINFVGSTVRRNVAKAYKLNSDGTAFEYDPTSKEIKPFEAYFKDKY